MDRLHRAPARRSPTTMLATLAFAAAAGLACVGPVRFPIEGSEPSRGEPVETATAGSAPGAAPVGFAVFEWRLQRLDGAVVEFAELRGRPVVLNVWATWCAPCVAELASLRALRDSLTTDPAGQSVVFVMLAPERAERVEAFARRTELGLPFHVELDALPAAFDVRALPTTIVIDRAGRIVLHHRGAADWNTRAMRDFLRGLAG